MGSPSDKPVAFITGLNSFTGYYLARELADAGYSVTGTTQHKDENLSGSYPVDICDAGALNAIVENIQPDIVAHLAAISFVAHENVDELYKVNLLGTRNLLTSCTKLNKKPRSILLASSANLYGSITSERIDENHATSPSNDYGVSKYAMEALARLYNDSLPITIVRPFNYTGVGQSSQFLLPKIVSHFVHRKTTIELGNIDVYRDWSDVRDVSKIYRGLLQKPSNGETYNICSGISYSIREVINMLSEISGHKIEISINPEFVRKNDIKTLCGNGSKLDATLPGITRRELHETLTWMYDHGRNNL